jgi:hypothetical protein
MHPSEERTSRVPGRVVHRSLLALEMDHKRISGSIPCKFWSVMLRTRLSQGDQTRINENLDHETKLVEWTEILRVIARIAFSIDSAT